VHGYNVMEKWLSLLARLPVATKMSWDDPRNKKTQTWCDSIFREPEPKFAGPNLAMVQVVG
jgi:hypothetical protein